MSCNTQCMVYAQNDLPHHGFWHPPGPAAEKQTPRILVLRSFLGPLAWAMGGLRIDEFFLLYMWEPQKFRILLRPQY